MTDLLKERIIGITLAIAILAALVLYSQHILRPPGMDIDIESTKAFYEIPDNSVDVMFYGSSHPWVAVVPNNLYRDYGITSFNYASDWQCLSTEALYFFDSLRTQTPKVAMVETYRVNDVIKDQDMIGEIYYTRALRSSSYKNEYLKKAFGKDIERYIAYYFPFSQFHSSWNELTKKNFTVNKRDKDFFVSTNGHTRDETNFEKRTVKVEIPDPDTFPQKKLRPESIEILDKMVEACEEKQIKLVLYTIPWQGENKYHDALSRYAKEHDCVYIDLFYHMDEIGLDFEKDFRDTGHLNSYGAEKLTDYLGKYLTKILSH